MIVLQASGSMDQKPSASSSSPSTKVATMRGNHRRKRSKGTIAGFASAKDGSGSVNNLDSSTSDHDSIKNRKSATTGLPLAVSSSQQPSTIDSSLPPSKPSTYGRMALMCTQNAVRLGARAQLNLCPPGRVRRELQAELRQRNRVQQQQMQNMSSRNKIGYVSEGYFGLEKFLGADTLEDYEVQEEEYLINTSALEGNSDEEASSGDEDDLCPLDDFFSDNARPLDDQEIYMKLREPLYAPFGTEPGTNAGAGMNSATNNSSKLPFNRRKVRFFDLVTADETSAVREYLRKEETKSKKRSTIMLKRHLRRVQWEERRRRRLEKGETTDDGTDLDRPDPEETEILDAGVSRFENPMTPAMSASFLIESLTLNPRESIEGMAKCYEGIVAAGVAILDSMTVDPTSPPNADGRNRPNRSHIMAALAPLLITTLEQSSGDAIRMLAKLRRMCATDRYRRRFVQRIAPCLIRPPDGAMWCLRHQNDMEAILAAAELIFDAAFDVFSKGWYERGQLMLADTKRAETLSSAAEQLRNLSSEPADGLALGFTGHANRRRMVSTEANANEPLAEWEVIAVDKQIRISISLIRSTDWTRATVTDAPKPSARRSVSAGRRPSGVQHSGDISPRASPGKLPTSFIKPSQSPPSMPIFGLHQSLNSADIAASPHDRADSPPPPSLQPFHQSVLDNRFGRERNGGRSPPNTLSASTPPMSPKSPIKSTTDASLRDQLNTSLGSSPKRTTGRKEFPGTPLSPSASSVGTNASGDLVSLKPSVTSAMASPQVSGAASHYRMLTSTAAERKRTVAACRALRAQIQRFEDAFIQLHGRPPKGAADRAPLATTYAQYREWKRAIRADAACRIQALFRGARTRWKLLLSNNSNITRVVMKGAGRSGYTASDNVINQISLPIEIDRSDHDAGSSIASTQSDIFGDSRQTLDPQWSNQSGRRRIVTNDRAANESLPGSQVPKPYSAAPLTFPQADGSTLSFAELQARKRELKQQLKQYDMNFARKHGRMPVKSEKEPIRHLYESYNTLKHQITVAEQESRNLQATAPTTVSGVMPQRASTPQPAPESAISNIETDAAAKSSPLPARNKRKVPKALAPPIASPPSSAGSMPPVSNTGGNQDLVALKAEKSTLHHMLRAYEKDFFKEHRRQVSSFADIRPVASQYRRYKDIKKAIAAAQQGGSER